MTNRVIQGNTRISITIEVYIYKEDEYFVAYCPALEVSGYGKTAKDAKKSFDIEVNIFLEETHKRGTLEKYLLKHGWRLQLIPKARYESPRYNPELFGIIKKSQEQFMENISLPV